MYIYTCIHMSQTSTDRGSTSWCSQRRVRFLKDAGNTPYSQFASRDIRPAGAQALESLCALPIDKRVPGLPNPWKAYCT